MERSLLSFETSAAKACLWQVQSEPQAAQIQIKLPSGVVITLPVEAIDTLPRILDRVA